MALLVEEEVSTDTGAALADEVSNKPRTVKIGVRAKIAIRLANYIDDIQSALSNISSEHTS